MAENTKIEWATHTFNPWIGCSHKTWKVGDLKAHPGCFHCYAEAQAGRHGVTWGPDGTRRKTSEAYWRKPLFWDRKAKLLREEYAEYCQEKDLQPWPSPPERPRVFSSLCDPFEDWEGPIEHGSGALTGDPILRCVNGGVPEWETMDDVRLDYYRLIDQTQNLDWLLLTKRPENAHAMLNMLVRDRCGPESPADSVLPVPNLWLGVSVSDQTTADSLIPELLKLRAYARVLFVSVEPLLGAIDLRLRIEPPTGADLPATPWSVVDWVIVGGESGRKARPCNVEWIEQIAEDCSAAGVPLFVKQLGANTDHVVGEKTVTAGFAGQRLVKIRLSHPKGGDPTEWPDDLRIREVPEA